MIRIRKTTHWFDVIGTGVKALYFVERRKTFWIFAWWEVQFIADTPKAAAEVAANIQRHTDEELVLWF